MKPNHAGALLFAVITAFILTLVVSTLVILTSNQYRIIDREIDRIAAFYRAQAGMEYNTWQSYTNTAWLPPPGPPVTHEVTLPNFPANRNTVNIRITNPDPDGISSYQVRISANY